MLTRANLDIAKLAAKEDSRYMLRGIRVTPEHTEVTDGHCLMRVATPKMSVKDFPVIEGASAGTDQFEPFQIFSEDALAVSKAIPRKATFPVLQHAAVGKASDANGHAELQVTDLQCPRVFQARKMEGPWPDTDRVIPEKGKAKLSIGLNADLLVKILQQFIAQHRAEGTSRGKLPFAVQLSFTDAENAVRIDSVGLPQESVAVLMPMRV